MEEEEDLPPPLFVLWLLLCAALRSTYVTL